MTIDTAAACGVKMSPVASPAPPAGSSHSSALDDADLKLVVSEDFAKAYASEACAEDGLTATCVLFWVAATKRPPATMAPAAA